MLDKDDRKDKRLERKTEKAAKKEAKVAIIPDRVAKEIAAATAPVKKGTAPAGMEPIIGEKFGSKMAEMGQTHKPTSEELPELKREELIDIETKQKRRRWMDIVSGAMTGLQGKTVDRSQLPTQVLQARKDKIYQDYKDAAERNRVMANVWNENEYNRKSALLREAYSRDMTPEEREQYDSKQKLIDDEFNLRKRESEARISEGKASQAIRRTEAANRAKYLEIQAGKKPTKSIYVDAYNEQTADSPVILNDIATLLGIDTSKGMDPELEARLSKTLMSKMFTEEKDDEGNPALVPIEGAEGFLENIDSKLEEVDAMLSQLAEDKKTYQNERSSANRRQKQKLDAEFRERENKIKGQVRIAQSKILKLYKSGPTPKKETDRNIDKLITGKSLK